MKIFQTIFGSLVGVILLSHSVFGLEISISSPVDGEKVNQRHYIVGEVSDPSADVIVVVHPVSVSEFWIQPPVTVRKNGQWRVKAYFGRQGMDYGEEYEVRAFANPRPQIKEGKYNSWPTAEAKSEVVVVIRK